MSLYGVEIQMIYGNTVLITGASSGIGKNIAQALANKGYRVYGTSRKPVRKVAQIFVILRIKGLY